MFLLIRPLGLDRAVTVKVAAHGPLRVLLLGDELVIEVLETVR